MSPQANKQPYRPRSKRTQYKPLRPSTSLGNQQQQRSQLQPENTQARQYDSSNGAVVKLKIANIPFERRNIRDLYNAIIGSGIDAPVVKINIPDAFNQDVAYVEFSPPPKHDFWTEHNISMNVKNHYTRLVVSLVRQRHDFDKMRSHTGQVRNSRMTLYSSKMDIGFMYSPETMMVMATATCKSIKPEDRIQFTANFERTELEVRFPFELESLSRVKAIRTQYLRFSIAFTQIGKIQEKDYCIGGRQLRLLIVQLQSPPRWFKKLHDIREGMPNINGPDYWNEYLAWDRQTDITWDNRLLGARSIQVHNPHAALDLGRWLTFNIQFDLDLDGLADYEILRKALKDRNIEIEIITSSKFETIPKPVCDIWNILNAGTENQPTLGGLWGLHEMSTGIKHLSFPVRYQLEVCISKGYINEYNLTEEFVRRLGELSDDVATAKLESIVEKRQRVFEPMTIFNMRSYRSSIPKVLPSYCVLTRSCTITPTCVVWNSPVVDASNRVIRHYRAYADRFLRVRFSDELHIGKLWYKKEMPQENVYIRIAQAMNNGIKLGDRHYDFLAFGNSQFREHGAYFFASLPELHVTDMRAQLGDLAEIRIPSKWCARLGQNFSSTRSIRTTVLVEDKLNDIERNGFNFTDGVGKISEFLSRMIADEFRLPNAANDPPSVFQFRLGGCKGVLAVAPELRGQEVQIRPSQYKFPAKHHGLEIVRTSQFAGSVLNRQFISLLSSLGIEDDIFMNMMQNMLRDLDRSMEESSAALSLLQKNVDFNQSTLTLAGMILNGFMDKKEPFVMSLLRLWRVWTLKYLKESARIFVGEGAHLLGCVDEYGVLQGHFNELITNPGGIQAEEDLPEIFVKVDPERNGRYRVIEGLCILARSPSLHPGDIRVVRAVNKPELQHLKNVVVLPTTGDQDLASMCSGGDVDGDDFLVIWDQSLIPPQRNHAPMAFTAAKAKPLDREVCINDITNFFVQYMKNDNLGNIANAHLAWSDQIGPKSDTCLRLAGLHSFAVDYPKSGIEVKMSKQLQPRKWPHFMEKKKSIYKSTKILGQLFDAVEREDFKPGMEMKFDDRILHAYDLDDQMLEKARELKVEYDASMRGVMAHHAIATEFEVFSAFVLSHNQEKKDYSFAQDLGVISQAITDKFKKLCITAVGGKDNDKLLPFVAAIYKVTAEEYEKSEETSMISFPWIFHRELGRIALGYSITDRLKAVQGLAKRQQAGRPSTAIDNFDSTILLDKGPVPTGEFLTLFDGDEETSAPSEKSNAWEGQAHFNQQDHETSTSKTVIKQADMPSVMSEKSSPELVPRELSMASPLDKHERGEEPNITNSANHISVHERVESECSTRSVEVPLCQNEADDEIGRLMDDVFSQSSSERASSISSQASDLHERYHLAGTTKAYSLVDLSDDEPTYEKPPSSTESIASDQFSEEVQHSVSTVPSSPIYESSYGNAMLPPMDQIEIPDMRSLTPDEVQPATEIVAAQPSAIDRLRRMMNS